MLNSKDALHELMMKVHEDNSLMNVFHQEVLNSVIYTLVLATDSESDENDYLSLYHWQLEHQIDAIAFFSSEEKALSALSGIDNAANNSLKVKVIKIPAKKLFLLTLEQTLVLNPTSQVSKLFYKEEILNLLQGTNTAIIKNTMIGPTRFFVLDEKPEALLSHAMTKLKNMRNIKKAYLIGFESKLTSEAIEEEKGFLLGIELIVKNKGNTIDTIAQEIGEDLIEYIKIEDILDIAEILPNCAISQFMIQNVEPFYEFRAGSFLRDISLHKKS
ncbi:enhanced serine sensitivity protein SseB C-terminal domain-containing protein [Thorsellia kenyensis]|uniref:Enhanced serine sensitivity protein SseB C-terminal domain-containing protein n=1 Tax=Thorsellia kenyensis TaxID=1549888 RepID=A0ABV6C6P1_9GAMM